MDELNLDQKLLLIKAALDAVEGMRLAALQLQAVGVDPDPVESLRSEAMDALLLGDAQKVVDLGNKATVLFKDTMNSVDNPWEG